MRIRTLAVIAMLVALTGCAAKHWTKAGATEADFQRDSYQCALEAKQQVTREDREAINKDLYRACMGVRGYRRVEGGTWEGFRD